MYTGSDHVEGAKLLNRTEDDPSATEDTLQLRGEKTGAALFYAARGQDDEQITIGFALYPPKNDLREKTRWGVRAPSRPDDPIVRSEDVSQ